MGLDEIRRLAAQARDHADRAKQLEAERDDAIRLALANGIRVTDLAEAAGVSLARIYQVRDRRR